MRRGTAAATRTPARTMPHPPGAPSHGHLSANSRTAVPTRVHQSGGQPHPAPAHGRALTRPPPTPHGVNGVAAATPLSTSFVLASLRALHVDSEAPPPAQA